MAMAVRPAFMIMSRHNAQLTQCGGKKMGVDKKTKIKSLTVIIDKNKKLFDLMEEHNIRWSGEDEHKKNPQLLLSEELGDIQTEEFYFDAETGCICFNGIADTPNGSFFVSFDFPLSDILLIDILQQSIKRLNKLKTVLESLI